MDYLVVVMAKSISEDINLNQPVDWDGVDFGAKIDELKSFNRNSLVADRFDVTDSEFHDFSPESAAKFMDKDSESILKFNATTASFSILEPRLSRLSDKDETIGTYFYKRSEYPEDSRNKLPILKEERNAVANPIKPKLKTEKSMAMKKQNFGNRRSLAGGQGLGRESITSMFISAKSDGFSSEDIINHVMKYCNEVQAENLPQDEGIKPKQSGVGEDTFSRGILDVSSISSIDEYSTLHSTPKRSSRVDLSRVSFRSQNEIKGTSHVSDLLPMLSKLPANNRSGETEKSTNSSQDNTLKAPVRNISELSISHRSDVTSKFSAASISTQLKPKSGIFRVPVPPKPGKIRPNPKDIISGHLSFQSRIRRSEPVSTSREPVYQKPSPSYEEPEPIVKRELDIEVEMETRNTSPNSSISSSATTSSNAATQCQLQTQTSLHQPSQPIFGFPIFLQVQCPCNHGAMHGMGPQIGMQQGPFHPTNSFYNHPQSHTSQMFPMMPMMTMPVPAYPPYAQQHFQSVPNTHCHCTNCCK